MSFRFFGTARLVERFITICDKMIVEARSIACTTRERYIQSSRRIDLPYEDISQRTSLLFAAVPLYQQCVGILFYPRHSQWFAGYQYDNHRFSGFLDFLQQFFLYSGKFQRREVESFSGSGIFRTSAQIGTACSDGNDCQITAANGFHRFRYLILFTTPPVTSFGMANRYFIS